MRVRARGSLDVPIHSGVNACVLLSPPPLAVEMSDTAEGLQLQINEAKAFADEVGLVGQRAKSVPCRHGM